MPTAAPEHAGAKGWPLGNWSSLRMLLLLAAASAEMCPDDGWTLWIEGGGCYKVIDEHHDALECARACRDDAAPVCIGSLAEEQFVSGLTQGVGDVWIGHYLSTGDGERDGRWDRCASGETTSFSSFVDGQPDGRSVLDGGGIIQPCVRLHGGYRNGWENVACTIKMPCVCELGAPSSHEYISVVRANLDAAWAIYRKHATILFGAIVPVLWFLPAALLACYSRLASRLRASTVSPSVATEDPPYADAWATRHRSGTADACAARLEAAEEAGRRLHMRIYVAIYQLGWMLTVLSFVPLLYTVGTGIDLTPVIGTPFYYLAGALPSVGLSLFTLRPTDTKRIHIECAFAFCFYTSMVLFCVAMAASPTLNETRNPISSATFALIALKFALLAALLWPALNVRLCCAIPKPMPPRRQLLRLWLCTRLMLGGFSLVVFGFFFVPLHEDGTVTPNGRSDDDQTALLIISACALTFAALTTPAKRSRIRSFLTHCCASDHEQQKAATIAALGGSEAAKQTYQRASHQFRVLPLDALACDDLTSESDTGLRERTVPASLGQCDGYVSHSHRDDGAAKYAALRTWGGTRPRATLWLDKACDARDGGGSALAMLPHFLIGSQSLLVLFGRTFPSRLWVLLETFVFVQVGGGAKAIDVRPLDAAAPLSNAIAGLSVSEARCFVQADRERILAVIEVGFGDLAQFDKIARDLLSDALQAGGEVRKPVPPSIGLSVLGPSSPQGLLGAASRIFAAVRRSTSTSSAQQSTRIAPAEGATIQLPSLPPLPVAAEDNDWADLAGCGGCWIERTERRAISLTQLEKVVEHIRRRLSGSGRSGQWCAREGRERGWAVRRFVDGRMLERTVSDAAEVNLYDVDAHLIRPSTKARQCSFVELVASDEQPPDFFVSHFWAEPVLAFVACLSQHTDDRRLLVKEGYHDGTLVSPHPNYLGGRSPCYWVCAYANNQHKLGDEITDDVMQTSFVKALKLARGTVSVVDASAGCFTRIWCILELNQALVASHSAMGGGSVAAGGAAGYLYDLYSAHTHTRGYPAKKYDAVGLTDGLAAADPSATNKKQREEHLPLGLINKGLTLACTEAQASVATDKERILAHIGDGHVELNERLHGFLASAALRRGLDEGGERRAQYLQKLRHGRVRKVQLDLLGSDDDTQPFLDELFDCLDAAHLEALAIRYVDEASTVPQKLCELVRLSSLQLPRWTLVTSLPAALGQLTSLLSLSLEGCTALTLLPDSIGDLGSLQRLDLAFCQALTQLPDSVCRLHRLEVLQLQSCYELPALPTRVGQLVCLHSLNLRMCESITTLPESIGDLISLTSLDLDSCSKLSMLPPSLGSLTSLESLNLFYCTKLRAIPDLSALSKLETVNTDGLQSGLAEGWLQGGRAYFAREQEHGYEVIDITHS